jgi:hypothetical protein
MKPTPNGRIALVMPRSSHIMGTDFALFAGSFHIW